MGSAIGVLRVAALARKVKLKGTGICRGAGACAVAQGEQRRREQLVQRNVRWAPLFEESRGSTGAPCACRA